MFHWSDVLDGAPPQRRHRGEGSYVVYHGSEVGRDYRVGYQTVVWMRGDHGDHDPASGPGHATHTGRERPVADHLHVEELVNIQKRTLLEVMQRVRDTSDQRAAAARSRFAAFLARQRARADDNPPRLRTAGRRFVAVEARVGFAAIEGLRRATHAAVEVPDKVVSAALELESMMATRMGRQTLMEAIRNPGDLSLKEKGVVITLTLALALLAVLFLNSFFALVFPEHASTYRRVLSDTTIMFLGVLGLPLIVEPLFVLSVLAVGPYLAVLAYFTGRMAAVWVLYLLGDALHDTLDKQTRRSRRLKRGVEWMRANADRYGGIILFVTAAGPLVPEVAFYVFAVSGIRFRTWVMSIGVGTAIKFGGLAVAVTLLGPDAVRAFLANPLG